MKKNIPENIHGDIPPMRQGIEILLKDLESASYLKTNFILGLISGENLTELDEDSAEYFLDIYTNAHMGKRKEFTILDNDYGRLSWIDFIAYEMSTNSGTSEIELSHENIQQIYDAFCVYTEKFLKKHTTTPIEIHPISQKIKHSFQYIIDENNEK